MEQLNAEPPAQRRRRGRGAVTRFLVAFYALAAIWGIRNALADGSTRIDVLFPFVMPLVLGCWAVADSIRRGCPIPLLSRCWFVLGAGVLVPGYVVWTRGWLRGLGLLVLHLVAWFGAVMVVMNVTLAMLSR